MRAAGEIAVFAAGKGPDDVGNDAQLRNAILFSLTVIGHAAERIVAVLLSQAVPKPAVTLA